MKKALVYIATFGFVLSLAWPIRLPQTYIGLMAVKVGAICLAMVASLDALLTGGAQKPRYLLILPMLSALIVGDVPTGFIVLAEGFRIYSVPTGTMQPSVMVGDRVVADRRYFETREPKRGDVVLLRDDAPIIKRVVAVEGDVIEGLGDQVWLNGQLLPEPYVRHTGGAGSSRRLTFGPIRVLPGKLFLMGDNRDVSFDSRDPSFGQVSVRSILGKILYIYASRIPGRWGKTIR